MWKRTLLLCGLGLVVLIAICVAVTPGEITTVARAVKEAPGGDSYVVTVRRWEDHGRGGRYKRQNDRFSIELSHRGGLPVSAYELEGTVPITNAVITWPQLKQFVVVFDNTPVVRCTLDEGTPRWESK